MSLLTMRNKNKLFKSEPVFIYMPITAGEIVDFELVAATYETTPIESYATSQPVEPDSVEFTTYAERHKQIRRLYFNDGQISIDVSNPPRINHRGYDWKVLSVDERQTRSYMKVVIGMLDDRINP